MSFYVSKMFVVLELRITNTHIESLLTVKVMVIDCAASPDIRYDFRKLQKRSKNAPRMREGFSKNAFKKDKHWFLIMIETTFHSQQTCRRWAPLRFLPYESASLLVRSASGPSPWALERSASSPQPGRSSFTRILLRTLHVTIISTRSKWLKAKAFFDMIFNDYPWFIMAWEAHIRSSWVGETDIRLFLLQYPVSSPVRSSCKLCLETGER